MMSNDYLFVGPSVPAVIMQNPYGFETSDMYEPGCSGPIYCHDIKNFMKLIKSNYDYSNSTFLEDEPLDKDKIMELMNSKFREQFLKELTVKFNHDCCTLLYHHIRLDAYEFLMGQGIITLNGSSNTISIKDILYVLFLESSNKNKKRQELYIDFFWNNLISLDQKIITDFRTEKLQSYLYAILEGQNRDIIKKYFKSFMELWDTYYPEIEPPSTPQYDEFVDGVTPYLQLARHNLTSELEMLFSRKSYRPNSYEWRFTSKKNADFISVPIISYLLEEFSWITNERNLKKLAKVIRTLIVHGKINYDEVVPETNATLMDYLTQYKYIYDNSPVMAVFVNDKLKPVTNTQIAYKYKASPDIPFSQIWNKYEYTKDSQCGRQIVDECMEEEFRTGHSSYNFLKESGLIFITSMLINDENNWL